MEERLPRKLAVILHADVVGYSRLAGEDEDDTHIRLQESLNLISKAVTAYHGRVTIHIQNGKCVKLEEVVTLLKEDDWSVFVPVRVSHET